MNAVTRLSHEFVEFVPEELKDGTLYISMTFATAVHRCCCGCGNEVVTPLSRTDWKLTFDGESISLSPSIGNWSFDCKSHYWIENNNVRLARRWSQEQIDAGRAQDKLVKEKYFESRSVGRDARPAPIASELSESKSNGSFWSRLRKWWSRNKME